MKSSDGEEVPLVLPVSVAEEGVELWLSKLADSMVKTLQSKLAESLQNVQAPIGHVIESFPSQIICLRELVLFTQDVERSIETVQVEALSAQYEQKLSELTAMPVGSEVSMLKVKSLVLEVIHNKSVLELLRKCSIKSKGEWEWQK